MKMRKITSLTAGLAFVLVLLTSIILYIVPQGRVAYWADWRFWGLSKTDWGNIHINLGFLFLIALLLHIYYNWKPLTAYLKNKARQMRIFTMEFNVALMITVVCTAGTYFLVPPFGWVMSLNEHFKEAGVLKYGEPPYGHAELSSLEVFAQKMNLDLQKSLARLDRAGLTVDDPAQSLAEIAKRHGVPPQTLFLTMRAVESKADAAQGAPRSLPDVPPPGSGRLSLADFCAQHGLDLKRVLEGLAARGVAASETQSLKEIAAQNNVSPVDIYEHIRGAL